MRTVAIAGREVGPGHPCFVIAEAGVNHDGDPGRALALVDAGAAAGACAVKFQTFRAERLATPAAPKCEYQLETTGGTESHLDMLRRLELSPDVHRALVERCLARGVPFLSSPFDEESAALLDGLGVPAFKVPSGELTNLPFLADLARRGRPLIVSTGMADLREVEAAVRAIDAAGGRDLVLLHCVSDSPADPADANLRAMETLARTFGVPVGFSDHTLGIEVALAAVALGACVVEKHFTLDKTARGPDHRASLEPRELAALVRGIRRVESALGTGEKRPAARELAVARVARKSLVAARALAAGTVLAAGDLAARRPGTGLPPSELARVLGRRLRHALAEGTMLAPESLE